VVAEVIAMADMTFNQPTRRTRSLGGVIWFVWMVGMWIGFFVLLFANQLDALWRWITQLPIVVEIVMWVAFLPWMLATWVWTGDWPALLRATLVAIFAIGWTFISYPRRKEVAAG
jgi:hypothetical protein